MTSGVLMLPSVAKLLKNRKGEEEALAQPGTISSIRIGQAEILN
jgi:hypothetical protein